MFSLIQHRLTPRIVFTLIFELVALNLVFTALLFSRFAKWSSLSEAVEYAGPIVAFGLSATFVIQFGLWSFGLYSREVIYSGTRVTRRLLGAFLFLSLALFPVVYLFERTGIPAFELTLKWYVVLLGVFLLVVAAERYLVLRIFEESSHLGNVIVIGTRECVPTLIQEARKHHGQTLNLVGILAECEGRVGQTIEGVRVLGTLTQTQKVVRDLRVKTILLALPYNHPKLPLDFLVECRLGGVNVLDACVFYEAVAQKLLVEKLDPFALLLSGGYSMGRRSRFLKSAGEQALALGLLTVFALPLIAAAIAVRLTSPGPVIYRQKRVGKGGRVFTLLKFRTMREDAERATGAVWAEKQDPRVTRVGRWLRRTRFDELPQLLNILKGDMAFVGPRPERPEFVEDLKKKIPFYHHRHFVKPGLTGWAQVNYPYGNTTEDAREKLRYDLYYVKHVSFLLDLLIILGTAQAVARGEGMAAVAKPQNPEMARSQDTRMQPRTEAAEAVSPKPEALEPRPEEMNRPVDRRIPLSTSAT